MSEKTETLIVPRGGSMVPVAARIAALVAQGWKVGEVRFELYYPVAPARGLTLTGMPKSPRNRKPR